MVLTLDMLLDIGPVEIHVAKIAGRVPLGLIAEVLRRRIAALAAGAHRPRADAVAELDHRDEAVPGGAVHLLRAGIGPRTERRQRSPPRRCEADRNARLAIVERLHDV